MSKSVYVIGPENGPYKIGISKNVKARFAALQTSNPARLSIHSEIRHDKARHVERLAHRILAEHRATGEWFDVSLSALQSALQRAVQMANDGVYEFPHNNLDARLEIRISSSVLDKIKETIPAQQRAAWIRTAIEKALNK